MFISLFGHQTLPIGRCSNGGILDARQKKLTRIPPINTCICICIFSITFISSVKGYSLSSCFEQLKLLLNYIPLN